MTSPPTYRQAVTAVGRMLRPRHGEARIHRVITRMPDGTFKVTVDRTITPANTNG